MSVGAIPVIILCGGEGTRLKAVTGGAQKVLVDVADEPFLGLLTRYLTSQGLRRFLYAAGYQGEAVASFARDLAQALGVEIEVAIEPRPLGTGGAIRFAASNVDADRFFVVNGDSLCEFDYATMERYHCDRDSVFTMALVAAEPKSDGGFVRLRGGALDHPDTDRISGFAEKDFHPDYSFLNAGTYLIERALLNRVPTDRAVSLERDLLPSWTSDRLFGFRTGSVLHDIGTPGRLLAFRDRIASRPDREQDGQDRQDA